MASYFKFPTLIKIHTEPTAITIDQGEGANGRLGFVCIPVEYVNIIIIIISIIIISIIIAQGLLKSVL